jgi:hypothetical protein
MNAATSPANSPYLFPFEGPAACINPVGVLELHKPPPEPVVVKAPVTVGTGTVTPGGSKYVVPDTMILPPGVKVVPSITTPGPCAGIPIDIDIGKDPVTIAGTVPPVGSKYVVPETTRVPRDVRVEPPMMMPESWGRISPVPPVGTT